MRTKLMVHREKPLPASRKDWRIASLFPRHTNNVISKVSDPVKRRKVSNMDYFSAIARIKKNRELAPVLWF